MSIVFIAPVSEYPPLHYCSRVPWSLFAFFQDPGDLIGVWTNTWAWFGFWSIKPTTTTPVWSPFLSSLPTAARLRFLFAFAEIDMHLHMPSLLTYIFFPLNSFTFVNKTKSWLSALSKSKSWIVTEIQLDLICLSPCPIFLNPFLLSKFPKCLKNNLLKAYQICDISNIKQQQRKRFDNLYIYSGSEKTTVKLLKCQAFVM